MPRPGEDPILNDSMPDAQKFAIMLEISRNRAVRKIQAEMSRTVQERKKRTDHLARFDKTRYGSTTIPGLPYVEPRFKPGCARFDLIVDYLFRHRQELALDTLHFQIAEHVLYWYIVREGFISLTPTEWRGFLQHCCNENVLFRYVEIQFPF